MRRKQRACRPGQRSDYRRSRGRRCRAGSRDAYLLRLPASAALTASYDNSGATSEATLTLDGKIYELFATPAASGVKYVSEEGRTPGKTLIWFTKGDDGTLYEGNVGGSEADETKLAECSPSDAAG